MSYKLLQIPGITRVSGFFVAARRYFVVKFCKHILMVIIIPFPKTLNMDALLEIIL